MLKGTRPAKARITRAVQDIYLKNMKTGKSGRIKDYLVDNITSIT